MIKETGSVVNIKNGMLWVETTVTSSCNACAAKSNCGTSAIAKAFSDKSVINEVHNTLKAKVGDKVEIGIPEESILFGSFYLYLLPLIIAISFAALTQLWLIRFISITEAHVILATFLGGTLGFFMAKYMINKSDQEKYQVQLLKILPDTDAIPIKAV